MSKFKGIYSVNEVDPTTKPFAKVTASGCRVETESGTVYWLGCPDDDGFRDIAREPAPDRTTGTMIMQPPASEEESLEIGDRFRGRLRSDIEVGMSLALDVFGHETHILSEVVVSVEPGDVPKELFR